jgi:Amt family ammonium transporter
MRIPLILAPLLAIVLAAAPALADPPAAPPPAPTAVAAPPGPATPTLEQRISSLEAYVNNGDPTASLKGKDGKIPDGLVTPTSATSGPGHNAWMMTSAALVLFMTLPGLFLFYGGLVRRKNILSVIAQCFGLAGLVTIFWVAFGYSAVFADGADTIGGVLGNFKFAFLKGVDSTPNTNYSFWVSHNVFAMYQLMFAIITPALILGAVAERIKYRAMLLFMAAWMIIVYFPLAHMIWGATGMMNGVGNASASIKAIDFAGGTVVHMSSGWSALILCLILGKRSGFPKEAMPPHSMVLCAIGTGMLWVGWYGFNAGSAVGADGIAANAFTTTTIATAVACFVWPMAEWILKGQPTVLGFCSGAVAGLVVITPACGFVTPMGALVIGVFAGLVPLFFCMKVKAWFGYDDALDTFGVHAVGGTMGALLTGFLARNVANANLATNLKGKVTDELFQPLVFEQLKAIGVTLVLAIVGTTIIGFAIKYSIGLRPTEAEEREGLDLSDHGEQGYHDGAGSEAA